MCLQNVATQNVQPCNDSYYVLLSSLGPSNQLAVGFILHNKSCIQKRKLLATFMMLCTPCEGRRRAWAKQMGGQNGLRKYPVLIVELGFYYINCIVVGWLSRQQHRLQVHHDHDMAMSAIYLLCVYLCVCGCECLCQDAAETEVLASLRLIQLCMQRALLLRLIS